MLTGVRLLHPGILEALAAAGHGSQVLIADGNYPASTTLGPNAALVHLNLSPDVVRVTDVLEVLLDVLPVEGAAVMAYDTAGPHRLTADRPIWTEFRRLLAEAGSEAELQPIERLQFYEQARGPDMALVVATADRRLYANLLLTVGAVLFD
ncbi:MAG: RbsD/FucU family protein [Acidimicrobiia bacterium]